MEEYPSPAEGIGLENRQGLNGPRGSNPSSSTIIFYYRGMEQFGSSSGS